MSDDKKRSKQSAEAPRGPSTFKFDPDALVIIGVDTKDGPEHPLYDPRAFRPLDENRLAMYVRLGIRVPIKVKHDGNRDVVVDGRGRVLYARAIKRQQIAAGVAPDEIIKVPALMERGTDEDLFGLSRALNLHDADDALANAKSVQRMMAFGKSEEDCAHTMGKSVQTIKNWLAMLDLAPEVQQSMLAQEMTPTAALQLAQLPRQEQIATLQEIKEETAAGHKPTVERVKAKVAEKAGREANPNTPKAKLEKVTALLMKLSGTANPSKGDLETYLDKISRVVTGHTVAKLGDIGD